jgi:hypothetical protein
VFENLSIGKSVVMAERAETMKNQRFAWWGPLKERLKKMVV